MVEFRTQGPSRLGRNCYREILRAAVEPRSSTQHQQAIRADQFLCKPAAWQTRCKSNQAAHEQTVSTSVGERRLAPQVIFDVDPETVGKPARNLSSESPA